MTSCWPKKSAPGPRRTGGEAAGMSTEAEELHRIISASVRDMKISLSAVSNAC